ncbi:MAG: substrate-binding domain-containing protein [Vallitaleaceae bacterium]|nr:substrate-binding domain-containing protein [Vallitaleaceae bacterium]
MNQLKRLFAVVLMTTLMVTIVGCGDKKVETAEVKEDVTTEAKAEVTTEAKEVAKELVVAGVVFQEDQFMKLMALGFEQAAKDLGVKCLSGNTANDQAKEAELVNTYLAQKVDGLAIAPLNQDSSVAALDAASKTGMKIAVTNIELTNAPFIVGGYTSNNYNIGQVTGQAAAQFIKEKLGGKAKIAIVQFKSLLPQQSADRVNGFLDEVKKVNPEVEIVSDQDAWLQDKAVAVVGDIITANPEVQVIYAANEGGTIGATMAVQNAGKAGSIFCFGTDASDQLISMLKDENNILQAITGQDPYAMGYNAMETLVKDLKGEDMSASYGKTIIVEGVLLSRANPEGITQFETDLKEKMGN